MPDYWWFFSMFERLSFLLPGFVNLHPNCKDWGKKCVLLPHPFVLVSGRYLFPSSTAHSISWENQKGFVPVIPKEKNYWNIVWSSSLWKGKSILPPKLQEVALYWCWSNIWSRGISCILKCHNSLGDIGSEQLICFKNNKTSPT